MKMLWCWRCREEVPMLDDEEFEKAHELYASMFKKTGTMQERAQELVDYYRDLTGVITHPNVIIHHGISLYGEPCEKCGKPYRTKLASFCAACGNKKQASS